MSAGAPQAVALITGAGTGIGYALSMVLLAENVHVSLLKCLWLLEKQNF